MDERDKHAEDDPKGTEKDDLDGTEGDDTVTPGEKGDGREKSVESQKKAWLRRLAEGETTLDDMPKNLGWLKDDPDFDKYRKGKKDEEPPETDKVRDAIREEKAEDEIRSMAESIEASGIDPEAEARLRAEYKSLMSDFERPTASQRLKCLRNAMRLAGIADEKAGKGVSLPSAGSLRRDTAKPKGMMSEIEKRLSGNLPPGYRA